MFAVSVGAELSAPARGEPYVVSVVVVVALCFGGAELSAPSRGEPCLVGVCAC